MSRIGKLPVTVPAGVEVTIGNENEVTVKGKNGTLTRKLHKDMIIKLENGVITVTKAERKDENKVKDEVMLSQKLKLESKPSKVINSSNYVEATCLYPFLRFNL